MQNLDIVVVALFAVATVVALVVRRLVVPYTVGLVLAGLAIGATHVLRPPHLTKELLFTVFLPGLLFEAAFHLDSRLTPSTMTPEWRGPPGGLRHAARDPR